MGPSKGHYPNPFLVSEHQPAHRPMIAAPMQASVQQGDDSMEEEEDLEWGSLAAPEEERESDENKKDSV